MAKKRSNPIEDPPTASSSEEEEEEKGESSEGEDLEEEEEGSTTEEEEEEDKTQTTPQILKTPPKKAGNSAGGTDAVESDESETDSDTDSSGSNVKPIATKPMEETLNAKKSRSKTTASTSGAKRPNESDQEAKELKKPKRKAGEEVTPTAPAGEEAKKTGEDTKKQLFQRLFSEDDEIALLKGMLDYYVKEGTDPCTDMNAFYDFVKKSIHTDVTKAQLMDKIRRLKKKFENHAVKGKQGEDKTFNKPHEQKAFDLSKKIWGKEGFTGKVESSAIKSNGKAKKKNNALAALKEEFLSSPEKKVGGAESMDVDKKGSSSRGILFDKRFGVGGLEEEVLNHGLEIVGGEKRAALEEKWRKLQVAELELFLQRSDLVKEQAEMLLEFYKSEDK